MANIQIFHEETGSTYNVSVVLSSSILSNSNMTRDSYLILTTTIPKLDRTSYPSYLIRDLSDTAPGAGAANDFTELVNGYIEYFVSESQLGQSSSSSSHSSSSSSTSSEGYSESSSSSGGYSESSSSSSSDSTQSESSSSNSL